jgi:hypothetical protein
VTLNTFESHRDLGITTVPESSSTQLMDGVVYYLYCLYRVTHNSLVSRCPYAGSLIVSSTIIPSFGPYTLYIPNHTSRLPYTYRTHSASMSRKPGHHHHKSSMSDEEQGKYLDRTARWSANLQRRHKYGIASLILSA